MGPGAGDQAGPGGGGMKHALLYSSGGPSPHVSPLFFVSKSTRQEQHNARPDDVSFQARLNPRRAGSMEKRRPESGDASSCHSREAARGS